MFGWLLLTYSFKSRSAIGHGRPSSAAGVVLISRAVPVELVEPISRHKQVRVGSEVMFKCKADIHTTISWYLNSTRLIDSRGVYVTRGVDRSGGVATSELHLQGVRRGDGGRYSCRSEQDSTDSDSVVLTVRDTQQRTSITHVL